MAVPIASKWHSSAVSPEDITAIDQKFTLLVLRASDDTDRQTVSSGSEGTFAKNAIAENRHNHWLIDLGTDVDAAVIAGMPQHPRTP